MAKVYFQVNVPIKNSVRPEQCGLHVLTGPADTWSDALRIARETCDTAAAAQRAGFPIPAGARTAGERAGCAPAGCSTGRPRPWTPGDTTGRSVPTGSSRPGGAPSRAPGPSRRRPQPVGEVAAGECPGLAHGAGDVLLHRPGGEVEGGGDLPVGEAGDRELGHLRLPGRESVGVRGAAGRAALRRQARAQQGPGPRGVPDGAQFGEAPGAVLQLGDRRQGGGAAGELRRRGGGALGGRVRRHGGGPVRRHGGVPVVSTVVPESSSVSDPVAAPVSDPVAAPVSDPVAAPVSDPVAAPVSDPVAAPVSAASTHRAAPSAVSAREYGRGSSA